LGLSRMAFATPAIAQGLIVGNCGPTSPAPVSLPLWQCTTLDYGYTDLVEEGYFVSAAADSTGRPVFAYYETDSYYGGGNLKVAYSRMLTYVPLIEKNK